MVGEIRDTETADLAIQAALTGHQVYSTIHTNSASGSPPRLLDMGVEPFLLTSALNAVLGQRVVRKICQRCKTEYNAPLEIIGSVKQVLGNLVSADKPSVLKLYKGQGCNFCGNTGYLGRTGIYEVLVMTSLINKLVLEHASSADIEKQAISEGMITMKQDGYMKVLEGITTLEEVLRVAQD